MEKSRDELFSELKELQLKYQKLEQKHNEALAKAIKKEQELRLRMMFLEGIANSTIDGYLVVNPFGQKILQNQRTIDLWKIPKEIINDPDGMKQVQHVMHMTVNPKQFIAEIDYLREHPNERSRDELELIDGTVLDRYSAPVIGADGENYGRIWTFHDVTERKKHEKQLVQLNTDKDRFISLLSHDLRSPFATLLGFAELLKKHWEKQSSEKTKLMVDSIYTLAHKTFDLLEDTLLWANVKSRVLTFNPAQLNAFHILTEIIELLSPVAKAKEIKIEANFSNEIPIFADNYMLKAILRNLVSNSIKFTNRGGNIEISAFRKNSATTIKVSDNGIGIPPWVKEKLFNISTVQSTQGTEKEAGTGLGLLLCKEFVDKHNGEISIASNENSGTTVSFTIQDLE